MLSIICTLIVEGAAFFDACHEALVAQECSPLVWDRPVKLKRDQCLFMYKECTVSSDSSRENLTAPSPKLLSVATFRRFGLNA